jgi:hypothetical protein
VLVIKRGIQPAGNFSADFREQIDLAAVDRMVDRSLRQSDPFGFVDMEDQLGLGYGGYYTRHCSRISQKGIRIIL